MATRLGCQVSDLKIGDVVRLKSGGPAMTVSRVADPCSQWTDIGVVWFPHRDIAYSLFAQEVQTCTFDSRLLEQVKQ